MKRYQRERKQYHLQFEDDDMAGFECLMTGVSLKEFIEISALAAQLEEPDGRTQENIRKQYQTLANCLIEWNLDDDKGKPVPCTYDGLARQDFDFVMQIMLGWMKAISSVSPPLQDDSNSGATSQERSLGLAGLSRSQAS